MTASDSDAVVTVIPAARTSDSVPDERRMISSLSVESRHDAFLTHPRVQLSSDGDTLYCQCRDKIHRLRVKSGLTHAKALESVDDPVLAFRLSADSRSVVSSHASGLLRLWGCPGDEVEVKHAWKSLHRGPVVALEFDVSGTLVASGGIDGNVRIWDVVHQHCTHSFRESTGVVNALAFYQPSAEEVFLLGSGDNSVIFCWNLTTSSVAHQFTGHFSKVTSLQVLTEKAQVISCGRDKVVMVWDLKKGSLIKTIPVHESVESSALVPVELKVGESSRQTGSQVVTAGEEGVLKVWDTSTSECVFKQEEAAGAAFTQLQIAKDAGMLVAVTQECNVLIYSLPDMKLYRQLVGNSDQVLDVVFCGRDEGHMAVATNSAAIKLYRTSTFDCQLVTGHTDVVLALSVCPADRSVFASASKDNTVRVWCVVNPGEDAASSDRQQPTVHCLAEGRGHTSAVTAIGWSQLTARQLFSGAEDRCLKVWNMPQSVLDWLRKPQGLPPADSVSLTCRQTDIGHEKTVNSVSASPNDKLLATASQDKTARLYRGDALQLVGVMRGHTRGVWTVTFSPVDQVVATASADCSVRLWSVSDASCVRTLDGHDSSVMRVTFLSRGMQLLSCSADGLVKLWAVRTGECQRTYGEHEAKVWALAARSDQRLLVTGGADSALIIWRDVTQEEEREALESAALRTVQEQKLNNLLQRREWLPALKLSITLRRPLRCLTILKQLRRASAADDDSDRQLTELLAQLRDDQLGTLLEFVAEWNTNSRHCHQAQLVVRLLLRRRLPAAWRQLPGHRQLLEALLPYTERHAERMVRLQRSVAFLDYTATCLKVTAATPAATQNTAATVENTAAKAESNGMNTDEKQETLHLVQQPETEDLETEDCDQSRAEMPTEEDDMPASDEESECTVTEQTTDIDPKQTRQNRTRPAKKNLGKRKKTSTPNVNKRTKSLTAKS